MTSRETIPSSLCLRITRRCNAACAFCQAPPTSREELSVADIGELAAFFGGRGVHTMKLSGGEPTMRRDLPDIIRVVASGGLTQASAR
ncbi:radical SAM protein [Actinacidiphila sp. ITFR-21]|uniref:radical SAM protein n=1 Tax=Actinacidiphila sp. ITFR-21 TaxID=3075199 RepID=UPI002889F463|nr:radical SAM protein [Streptomyces sp. ITFR-21]WNI17317.1 radical SAM protein [Streptomyces sp. ITFR-21]